MRKGKQWENGEIKPQRVTNSYYVQVIYVKTSVSYS